MLELCFFRTQIWQPKRHNCEVTMLLWGMVSSQTRQSSQKPFIRWPLCVEVYKITQKMISGLQKATRASFLEFMKICLVKLNPSPLCWPSKRKRSGSCCHRKSRHGEKTAPLETPGITAQHTQRHGQQSRSPLSNCSLFETDLSRQLVTISDVLHRLNVLGAYCRLTLHLRRRWCPALYRLLTIKKKNN